MAQPGTLGQTSFCLPSKKAKTEVYGKRLQATRQQWKIFPASLDVQDMKAFKPIPLAALWIVEDTGGKAGTTNKNAKQPNSFIYRFIPKNKHDLKAGGTLQALQVASKRHGGPIVFNPADPDADILSLDVKDLHTYGLTFDTRWVVIHDTEVDGFTPFDANAAAKLKKATPFKRPENGVFRPGTAFGEFYFTETGDTNKNTEAGSDFGGFGGVFKLSQKDPASDVGQLTIFYKSDVAHTGLDNIAFWSKNKLVVVEDAGDSLHTQRNALDSAYLFDLHTDYSQGSISQSAYLPRGAMLRQLSIRS